MKNLFIQLYLSNLYTLVFLYLSSKKNKIKYSNNRIHFKKVTLIYSHKKTTWRKGVKGIYSFLSLPEGFLTWEKFSLSFWIKKQLVVYSNNFVNFNKLQFCGFPQASSSSNFSINSKSHQVHHKAEANERQSELARVFQKILFAFFVIPLISKTFPL